MRKFSLRFVLAALAVALADEKSRWMPACWSDKA